MDKKLIPYYLSRIIIVVAITIFLLFTGTQTWIALLIGILILGFFLWAPHSGRYAVHPEFGITALRRDECTEVINDKAARNGFMVCMVALAILSISASPILLAGFSVNLLKLVIILGVIGYYLSDFWMRKVNQ
jgi:heme O synthase-like polyprenyltransferase